MAQRRKEPMIDQEARPTAIDYDAPIADWKYRDLVTVVAAQIVEHLKYTPVPEDIKPEIVKPELVKPERLKPELTKPEKEFIKPEKEVLKPEKERLKPELSKPEKEFIKPEKEVLKPEKERLKPEWTKPEKPWAIDELVERVAARVTEMMRGTKSRA